MKKTNLFNLVCLLVCAVLCGCLLAGCGSTAVAPGETLACTALSGKSSDTYEISGALTLDFSADEAAQTAFNRFDLEYELSAPVRGVIAYTIDDAAYTEEFYLSETQTTFSQLIDLYLNKKTAVSLQRITIEPLVEGPCTFQLKSAALAVQPVESSVITIENDRYVLGIKVSMGGAISQLEDKKSPRDDIENLLNNHDTGRLIQQSYYGVASHPEYENGRYMGNVWPYNPVQGGDLYNHRSKIVAISRAENSVTVVSRPLDWGKKDSLTYAYYTNTYTLQGDLIRVDNTVIDFSGFPNPVTTQELPAFYTISALKNFVYYSGGKSWTGDSLTYKTDLGFWGTDPACSLGLSPDNTEIWCAWVDENDYGVGLFTPNVEWLKAGRYQYNGSTHSKADATNYVAPVSNLALIPYKPICYSYLIGAGTVDELRAAFTANKDFAENADLHQTMDARYDFSAISFESEEDLAFTADPYLTSVRYENGCAVLSFTGGAVADPHVALHYSQNSKDLYAQEYPYMVVTYRTAADNSEAASIMELFLSPDMLREAKGGYSTYALLRTDGAFHSEILPLSETGFWNGRINQIRFDYFSDCEEGDTLYLYSICLAESEADAEKIASTQLKEAEKTLK